MTFYLSRYVRDDVSMEQFMDGLMDFMNAAMKDPQNNISEFDKSLSSMLEFKILNGFNPRNGLMFINPSAAAYILQHPFLIQLLFYPRVFQRKHEWPIIYLSPISRHLCQQNHLSKLPKIYQKYSREIDLNRGVIYISTLDYFFISFISYPIIIGPQIPKILNHLYSNYKYEREIDSIKKSHNAFFEFFKHILYVSENNPNTSDARMAPPLNPFKHINFYYSQIFECYLNLFLPNQLSPNANNTYDIKFIEIIGELWFGPKFAERPIGDRCFTLPLMQDLLFRIMRRQIAYQRHEFRSQNQSQNQNRQVSCLCPQLQCLLRYLYSFFRESFEFFPLDFIANLRIIIEMFLYVLAPWGIEYKLRNPDSNIQHLRQQIRNEWREKQMRANESVFSKIFSKLFGNNGNGTELTDTNPKTDFWGGNVPDNDDRMRDLQFNNTSFLTADAMVGYELDSIESCDFTVWKAYIIEMLPFYSELINDFIDILLKYDLTHPLKQLCILKVFHLYKNAEIIRLISDNENLLFNPMQNQNNQNRDTAVHVLNIINNITYEPINRYKCLPFNTGFQMTNSYANQYQQSGFINYKHLSESQQMTANKAKHLYIKCRKTMQRLCPQSNIESIERKEEESDDENKNENSENKESESSDDKNMIAAIFHWIVLVLKTIVSFFFGDSDSDGNDGTTKLMSKMSYFVDPSDNVKMIRYIVGDLEALFNIDMQQQQNLMNLSIMYEPSIINGSGYNSPKQRLQKQEQKYDTIDGNETEINNIHSSNVWNAPKGEWESYYLLKLSQFIYNGLISQNQTINDFYCAYLAALHRKYGTDKRIIAWLAILCVTRFICHYIIFYFALILFSLAVILPLLKTI